ncbi:MBL fold metallo-hydrolase [Nocardioides sp. MAHUQ-72]|uniref:MBL fold metallo-hydrolase n=1 Tax=unclassified Nocardioides TaxID=2615069 RepID=UPI00361C61E3
MTGSLAFTWWGHASTTVEVGGVRIVLDPLLTDRLLHLRRYGATPSLGAATRADVVMISHLHADHCHLPSLRLLPRSATVVVAPGGAGLVGRLGFERVVVAEPGEELRIEVSTGSFDVQVLAATHDGRRLPLPRSTGTAVGYRVAGAGRSFWYPGDTGLREDMREVEPVELALVPVGGWGPSLGPEHMDPAEAAEAVDRVGAAWAVPVHWGTFWPVGLRRLARRRHERLFLTPGDRFVAAVSAAGRASPLLAATGERVSLDA